MLKSDILRFYPISRHTSAGGFEHFSTDWGLEDQEFFKPAALGHGVGRRFAPQQGKPPRAKEGEEFGT
jgi:hypothetical protein